MIGLMSRIAGMAMLMAPLLAAAEDRFNIRTNPLMVFGNVVNLELDVRLGPRYSLGPVLRVNGSEPAYDVGLRLNRYEQGAFRTGWLWSVAATGGQVVGDYLYSDLGVSDERERGWLATLGVNQAYLWRWSTFNTTLGLGARLEYQDMEEQLRLRSDLQFSIGWVR